MKIEVLGPGCAKCETLAERTKAAADKLGLDYEFEKIADFNEIAKRGVLLTPALAVDGTVKVVGRVPDDEELAQLLEG